MRKRLGLRENFESFNKMLSEIKMRNDQFFIKMKNAHDAKLIDFVKEIKENKRNFDKTCPIEVGKETVASALKMMDEFKDQTDEFRERLDKMKFGMDLFKMNFVPAPELVQVETKIEELRMVWMKKQEWNDKWDELKIIKFPDIVWEQIEEICKEFIA